MATKEKSILEWIRKKLQEITDSKIPESEKCDLIKEFSKEEGLGFTVQEAAGERVEPGIKVTSDNIGGWPMNCFAYALGLNEASIRDKYIKIRMDTGKFTNPDFMLDLIKKKHLKKLDLGEFLKNELWNLLSTPPIVLYYNEKKPTHAGLWFIRDSKDSEKIIRSTWGNLGAIFEHKILHFPESHGQPQEYYQALSPEESLQYFYEYVNLKK